MATVQASLCQHRSKDIIAVQFAYDKELVKRFRQLPGARWSQTLKSWYVPDTAEYRKRFGINIIPTITGSTKAQEKPVKAVVSIANTNRNNNIYPCNSHVLPAMEQLLILKGYSPNTRRTYLAEVSVFLKLLKSNSADLLDEAAIKRYLVYCYEKLRLTENTLHSRINALKFYYEQVLGSQRFFWEIPRPKKPLLLPRLLNQAEIARLFNAPD